MAKILGEELGTSSHQPPNLVKYQWFVIVSRVILHDVKDGRILEDIHHLDPVEVDHDAATGSAGDVLHLVGLERGLQISFDLELWMIQFLIHLDIPDYGEEGNHHVKSRGGHTLKHGPASEVDPNMSLVNPMDRVLLGNSVRPS